MAYDPQFGEWVQEHFAGLGPLQIKRMFGAAAVYSEGLILALLDDGVVWLKADEENEPALRAAGATQFTYPMKDGSVMPMAYWSLPDAAVDDPEEAVRWGAAVGCGRGQEGCEEDAAEAAGVRSVSRLISSGVGT